MYILVSKHVPSFDPNSFPKNISLHTCNALYLVVCIHQSSLPLAGRHKVECYNFMDNLKCLFRVYRLKLISFRFPRLQHHDLYSTSDTFYCLYLEILGYLSRLFRADNSSNENGRCLWIARFVHCFLIRRHDVYIIPIDR
jgi:hypothetical protein